LEGQLQILRYEGAVPEDHPPHDGRLLGPEAVAERYVRAAVYLSYPSRVLVERPDTGSFDHRGDPLCGEVTGVIEAVFTGLGARDLPVHPHPVADPDAREVHGEDLDAPAPQDLLVIVPQVLDSEVRAVAVAALHRWRRDLPHHDHLARFERREFRQRVQRGGVQ